MSLRRGFLTAFISLALVLGPSRAQNNDANNPFGLSAAPDVDDFLRRSQARVALIGNYLYFDGGELSQLVDGQRPAGFNSNGVNRTLSIDISRSWHPRDVSVTEIQKAAPNMMRQALFVDRSSGSFYIWGGHTPNGAPIPDPELWRFSADGEGAGSWTTEVPSNPDEFERLQRSEGCAYVSTPDSGFCFGGDDPFRWASRDPAGPVPGYVQFNFTTQTWRNETRAPWSPYGTTYGGQAVYIDSFGPNGLVMLLGGGTPAIGADRNIGFLSMQNVTFMDPVTKEWYWQRTTGTAPSARQQHCAVGVAGPNNTFEIFVYGGRNVRSREGWDEIYVLSLPGFVWTKADYESVASRSGMGCAVAGQRQMIVVGGANVELGNPEFWYDADPFPQGLGIFDLTELAWKEQYDADAPVYDSPRVIKDWYSAGDLEQVSWSSPAVADLFTRRDTGGEDTATPGNNQQLEGSTGPAPLSTGSIAGIAVGGVAGAAMIGVLIWFLLRRRRLQGELQEKADASDSASKVAPMSYTAPPSYQSPSEVHGDPSRAEMHGDPRRVEMHDTSTRPKLPAKPDGWQHTAELDGSGVQEKRFSWV